MIGIEGQYVYSFTIGDFDDFIREEDLLEFSNIEFAGNILPEFLLAFNTTEERILSYLHEGNTLNVSFGKTIDTLKTVSLKINTKQTLKNSNSSVFVEIRGFLSAQGYLNNADMSISSETSAFEAISLEASRFFRVETNRDTSLDKMKWIRPMIPAKKLIDTMWLHSDLGDTGIPAVAIDSEGVFRLVDLQRTFNAEPAFEFTYQEATEENQINYDGDAVTDDQTSFINAWLGYDRKTLVYGREKAGLDVYSYVSEPLVSLTSQIARDSSITSKFGIPSVNTGNTHPNYWQSYVKNVSNLAQLSSTRVVLSFHDQFKNVRVLDKVSFVDNKVIDEGISSENNAGNYYVTKVSRTINNRRYVTLVEIHRESQNDVQVV